MNIKSITRLTCILIMLFKHAIAAEINTTSGEKSPIINNESGNVNIVYGKPFDEKTDGKENLFESPYKNLDSNEVNNIHDYRAKSIRLRHGFEYSFNNLYSNPSSFDINLKSVHTSLTEDADYNGTDEYKFSWTDEIKEKNYIIHPGEHIKYVKSDKKYQIIYHPENRSSDNLILIYKTLAYFKENGTWNKKPDIDIHIQPYEITWCGDGIVDNYLDSYSGKEIKEECDPNDPSKTNWGSNGCMKLLCKAVD